MGDSNENPGGRTKLSAGWWLAWLALVGACCGWLWWWSAAPVPLPGVQAVPMTPVASSVAAPASGPLPVVEAAPAVPKFTWRCDQVASVEASPADWPERLLSWAKVFDALYAAPDLRQRAATLRVVAMLSDGPDESPNVLQGLLQFKAEWLDVVQRTNDQAVYGWALRTCQSLSEPCALSKQGWAERDLHNAAPWLSILDDLDDQDVGGVEQALSRLAAASYNDDGSRALLKTLLSGIPTEVQGWPRLQLAQMALIFSLSDLDGGQSLQGLRRHCRADRLFDANRRQLCEGIYKTLLRVHDTGLMARALGGLGRDLGQAPSNEFDALLPGAATALREFEAPPPLTLTAAKASCLRGAMAWRYLEDWSDAGELQALRAFKARASGPDVSDPRAAGVTP